MNMIGFRPKKPTAAKATPSLLLTMLMGFAFLCYIAVASSTVQAADGLTIVEKPGEDYSKVVNPGSSATYTFELENTNEERLTVDLTAESSEGYIVQFQSETVTLEPNSSSDIIVTVRTSSVTEHGVVDQTEITAQAQGRPAAVDQSIVTTTIVAAGGLDVSIADIITAQSGAPSAQVILQYDVTNDGSEQETFTLSSTSAFGFPVTFTNSGGTVISEVTLDADATTRVRVRVTIPSSATDGQQDLITFRATSELDSSVFAESDGTVSVVTSVDPTDTPTPTNTPTRTPTPAVFTDQYEPNDTFQTATDLPTNGEVCDNTFWPLGDKDFFKFFVQEGLQYVIQTDETDSGIDPIMTLYDPEGRVLVTHDDIDDGGVPDVNARIGFIAEQTAFYFVHVENSSPADSTDKFYCVKMAETLVTPSPTPTETPTVTPTPTETPTITPTPTEDLGDDNCEPNETAAEACFITAGSTTSADFVPPYGSGDDVDFYRMFVRKQIEYTCSTVNLSRFADTTMEVRRAQGYVWLGDNNDKETANPGSGSEVTFTADFDGDVYIIIRSFTRPEQGLEDQYTYDLRCDASSPTATPEPTSTPEPTNTPEPTGTPAPTGTPIPDDCEPNNSPEDACFMAVGQTLGNDFLPTEGNRVDVDFFRMFVRRGVVYTCETSNLSSFADTRMEVRQQQGYAWLGDNNDRIPFEPTSGSLVEFQANVDGYVYVIVLPFTLPEPGFEEQYRYDLRCSAEAPTITPTPSETPEPTATLVPTRRPVTNPGTGTGGNTQPTATPTPDQPSPTPLPTPTPFMTLTPTATPVIDVRPLPTPEPTVTEPANVTLDVLIYYDENDNFTAESNEGVMDVAVSVYDNTTGDLLAFGYTNANGEVAFGPFDVQGALRVNVEFLNFSQIVSNSIGQLPIRIAPQQLPGLIP